MGLAFAGNRVKQHFCSKAELEAVFTGCHNLFNLLVLVASSTESDGDDEFSAQDDASAFEISCEGEEVWSTINSVNVLPATEVTSNEILELSDCDRYTDTDVYNVDTANEHIVRGQIDIGCSASCTGNRASVNYISSSEFVCSVTSHSKSRFRAGRVLATTRNACQTSGLFTCK